MRLDKFLKLSRLIKRRTVANEACDAGRVSLNGKVARASAEVKAGDIIEIQFGNKVTTAKVKLVKDVVRKEEADLMIVKRFPPQFPIRWSRETFFKIR